MPGKTSGNDDVKSRLVQRANSELPQIHCGTVLKKSQRTRLKIVLYSLRTLGMVQRWVDSFIVMMAFVNHMMQRTMKNAMCRISRSDGQADKRRPKTPVSNALKPMEKALKLRSQLRKPTASFDRLLFQKGKANPFVALTELEIVKKAPISQHQEKASRSQFEQWSSTKCAGIIKQKHQT